jgi:hypothetical protein
MRILASWIMFLSTTHAFQSTSRIVTRRPSTILLDKKSKTTLFREGTFWKAKIDGWRPTVNDVERISFGKPAKQKGTGSRGVPHRLNEDERFLFDQARSKGFLEIAGSGWRSQRREAPLLNTYRSLCDARAQASIVLHKGNTGIDELVVDISPLRYPEMFEEVAQHCLQHHVDGEVIYQGSSTQENEDDDDMEIINEEKSPWETRPIYQLPPYCVAWELPRSDGKELGKIMAKLFETSEGKKAGSKKPIGVKPGKSRRHGGYGIG